MRLFSTISNKWQGFVGENPVNALLGQFRRELLGIAIFSMIINLLMLTPTIYMLQVFDRFLKSQNGATLIAVSAIALFLFLIMAFAEWARARVLVRAGVRFDEMLNSEVFRASLSASLRNKNRNLSEAFSDLTNLRQFMTGVGVYAIFDTPWIPVYTLVSFLLHPLLGLLVLFFVVMLGGLLLWSQRFHGGIDQPLLEANLKTSSFIQAKLRHAEVIASMGMLDSLKARWKSLNGRQLAIGAVAHDRMERVQGLIKFVQYSQQSLTLAFGAFLVVEGQLTAGAMVAATMLVARACQPVQLFVSSWRASMAARISYQRLVELLETNPAPIAIETHKPVVGDVKVIDLSAKVEGRDQPILSNFAGIACGKLNGFKSISSPEWAIACFFGAAPHIWHNHDGQVLIDEIAVNDWDRHHLGRFLGYVPQDVELFDGTLADNISRFGAREPKKIVAAAKAAGVHEMILRLPQGYDTQMGVAGSALSGGQRQRLALARALYDDPSLVVLDEANANLDDAGEAALMSAVRRLRDAGKVVIFITHRSGVLAIADRIMLIDDGQMVAFGERDNVLAILRQQAAI